MDNFISFGLPEQLLSSLERLQFKCPTPIQLQTIPRALEGRDILGTAQTGTGKTAAFGIPLIARLLANQTSSALVMTPTRELAAQVIKVMHDLLGRQSGMKTALLIGGESIDKQLAQLKGRPRLIVGTPGRINDHLTRGSLKLNATNFLVLDETDRMLDMGFAPQIEKIAAFLPNERQTLLFSATLPKNIIVLAQKYLNNPERIAIGATTTPAAKIKQDMIHVSEIEKYDELVKQLNGREGSVIIFVKTKYGAEKIAARLRREHHSADAIHGNLRYNKREKVIRSFRDGKYRILVATDIAARGLDIPHVMHVINYDLPQCAEDYLHRIGRTARAGAEGSALCIVSPVDRVKWKAINNMMNPNEKKQDTRVVYKKPTFKKTRQSNR